MRRDLLAAAIGPVQTLLDSLHPKKTPQPSRHFQRHACRGAQSDSVVMTTESMLPRLLEKLAEADVGIVPLSGILWLVALHRA